MEDVVVQVENFYNQVFFVVLDRCYLHLFYWFFRLDIFSSLRVYEAFQHISC